MWYQHGNDDEAFVDVGSMDPTGDHNSGTGATVGPVDRSGDHNSYGITFVGD